LVVTIRDAVIADVPVMLEMLQDSACDQGFPNEVGITEEDLKDDGFGDSPKFLCVIAEWNGQAAGLALFFFTYSSWGSKTVLYLEDLFVRPEFRKKGVARSLLQRLAELAVKRNCSRMQWLVHAENSSALRFYETTGARRLTDWTVMTLKGDAVRRLMIS
jgi:GNAT superfamily N-acetyltransferase